MPGAGGTFQELVHALGSDPASGRGGRGLRFCYGREDPTHAGVELGWPRVAARVRGLARRLLAAGVDGGEVVLIHSHDQQTSLIAILACIHLGAVPAAVAPIAAGVAERLVQQFHAVAAVADAKALVIDRALPTELIAGRPPLPTTLLVEDWPEADDCAVPHRTGADDPCFIQFTSGSTSVPKGVVVSQRMVRANLRAITAATGWGPNGRSVGWIPIYHDMSLVGCYLTAVEHQARACLFPTSRFGRSPDLWMQLMAEERAEFSAGPNFGFAMVNRHAERRPPAGIDLGCVRGLICGAEPISPAVMRQFMALHAPLGLRGGPMPAYGMAECTLMATVCAAGAPVATLTVERQALEQQGAARIAMDSGDNSAGGNGAGPSATVELVACGTPALGMAVLIATDGAAVGDDRVGEVLLAGESVLSTYYRNPGATAAALTELAGRRWLRTGDLGFVHGGQLYICGRAKDLIIHNGVNYYPADVEQAVVVTLAEVVRLAAVVDLRQDLNAEFTGLGVLFEEARKGGDSTATERQVAEFVRAYTGLPVALACSARGGHIPRTTSGKLVRGEIRAQLVDELSRRATA